MEGELAEMKQEVEDDYQIQRSKNQKLFNNAAFMKIMEIRHKIEGYLLGKGKEPSECEPTNFVFSDEEWVIRLVRHQSAESQITVIRAELRELSQQDGDIR